MSDPTVRAPSPAARLSAIEWEVRRHRIMERVDRGWSRKSIAQAEDLTPRRVGQIVRQTLQPREVGHLHRAIFAHTPQIISQEVRDHHQLGGDVVGPAHSA